MVKGFKGFNEDLTCRGFQYEIGKTYKHNGEVELCRSGFHFCRKLKDVHNFYNLKTSRICEIEADGKIDDDGVKSVCSRMRIVREVSREEVWSIINIGEKNTGMFNSGDRNSGNLNSGDRNRGNDNSGNDNSGDYNSGDRNSGHLNSGTLNSGDLNSGNLNSGSYNSGDLNSGTRNSGNHNSGDFCSCDYSSGIFMTKKITYEAFNKQLTKEEYDDLIGSEGFRLLQRFRLYAFKTRTEKNGQKRLAYLSYKTSWRMFWQTLTPMQKLTVKRMPHFDADVFYEITGIRITQRHLFSSIATLQTVKSIDKHEED